MKKNLFYLSMLLFMGAIGICSCSSDPNSEDIVEPQTPETTVTPPVLEERKAINLSAFQRNVAEELNKFNLSFTSDACRYVDMINGNSDSNVICSPLGAEMIMSMVLNAVEDDQQTEILNYLGITDIESLNSLNANLIRSLSNADKATKFNISNALWVNNEKIKGLNPDYSSLFTDTYGGLINFGNFNRDNKSIIEDINEWGASKTDGMIQQYLKELKSSSFAIVLNALSFSSYWNNELFSKEPLTNEVFHGTHNDSNVKMMHSDKCAIKTAEDELFYLISLPYGNEAFNMFILLPKSDLTDSEMLSYISWERISQLKNDARYELAKISMPKFNISSAINVSDMLFNSGIKDWHKILNFTMFDEKKAGLIELNQGLSICVDEKGTDASAISSGVFIDSAMPDSDPGSLELKINRPFYFFIQEFSTDAMIMSGRISNL